MEFENRFVPMPSADERKAAYAPLDEWLVGVEVGDTKLLALSDFEATSRLNAMLAKADAEKSDRDRQLASIMMGQVAETVRGREDTIPGYADAQQELDNMVVGRIVPYQAKVYSHYQSTGQSGRIVPLLVADSLAARRSKILLKPR